MYICDEIGGRCNAVKSCVCLRGLLFRAYLTRDALIFNWSQENVFEKLNARLEKQACLAFTYGLP